MRTLSTLLAVTSSAFSSPFDLAASKNTPNPAIFTVLPSNNCSFNFSTKFCMVLLISPIESEERSCIFCAINAKSTVCPKVINCGKYFLGEFSTRGSDGLSTVLKITLILFSFRDLNSVFIHFADQR